jgi:hypothetical protein
VTISGAQEGTGFPLTFCVRKETAVRSGQAISLADAEALQVVDVSARDTAGCRYGKDAGAPDLMGTLVFAGFCTEAGAVYNLTVDGSLAGIKTCDVAGGPPASETVRLGLAGTVSVTMGDGM